MTGSSPKGAVLPTLIVTGGPRDGAMMTLKPVPSGVVLGSGPTCHLRLELGNIDLVHARVVWDSRGILVSDVGSAMGTYVNGEKIGADHLLADGDRVCLGPPGSKGSVKLLVRVPSGAADLAASAAAVAASDLAASDEETLTLNLEESQTLTLDAPDESSASSWASAPASAETVGFPAPGPTPAVVTSTVPSPSASVPPAPSVTAAPPAPAPPVGESAAQPASPTAPASEERKSAKPDYGSAPSIVADRVREDIVLPPMPSPQPAGAPWARFKVPALPREALLAIAGVVLALVVFVAYRATRRPPPVLEGVTPAKAEPGQAVSVQGTGFDTNAARNRVRFGDVVGQVTSATETQLNLTVPAGVNAGASVDYPVTVEVRGQRSNAFAFKVYKGPRVDALEPDVALPGQEVVLRGSNLEGRPLTVLVGGVSAEVKDMQPGSLRFVVPGLPLAEGRKVSVVVQSGMESARPAELILGRLPVITDLTPTKGLAGERVTLRGRGFDPRPEGSVVTFGGQPALVLSASATELVVSVPALPTATSQVQSPIAVQAGGHTSSSLLSFVLTRPSSGLFTLRFFAAPVPDHTGHDHAFVSTELGPVLLLTGRAESPSTAERAARVAAALNALVDEASARPLRLEAREAAVAVAERGDAVVTATPGDADGYGDGWDGSSRGRRPSPRILALYWTALLQDYFALFAQRERPTRVLEVSPRGRVLSEIYSESQRRLGPGGGVPAGVVRPLTSTLAKGVRDVALLLPAEGQARSAAAIEGVWDGTLEESGAGSRAVRVRFSFKGPRLVGFLSTRSGGVAMERGLEDVAYERGGSVRFTLTSGGSPRQFRGTLQGETIAGTIHDGGKEVGRFSLRFTE